MGQYKTPGMLGFIRAQRGRARSALSSRFLRSSFQIRHILNDMVPNLQLALLPEGFPFLLQNNYNY